MAEDKKSFVLYADYVEIFEELTNEDAGELVKHLFRYVNDQAPETENPMAKLAFIPIKQQLKRDLKKYEIICQRNSKNGAKGGRPQKPKKPSGLNGLKIKPRKADTDNDTDNDNEIPTEYSEKEFLKDWNILRLEHLKKPSFLNSISREEAAHFNDLKKQYSNTDFSNALIGLFKQKKMPNGNTTMQSNPKHFLTHFNAYLTAFHDKNNSLYGKDKIEAL